MIKAAGVAAGTLFIAIGLSAQLGGANLFARPSHTVVSRAPASTSPELSPSTRPSPQVESVTAAGSIYTGSQGGGKKKHGKR